MKGKTRMTTLTEVQRQQLEQPLDPSMVSEREGSNRRTLQYLKGCAAIANANKIFGAGNWGYDLVSCTQNVIMDPLTGEPVGIAYKAVVRVTVAGCEPVTDVGSQPVSAWNVQQVGARRVIMESHEQAEKAAVTDAMKRALRTFGNQFGNSLYGVPISR